MRRDHFAYRHFNLICRSDINTIDTLSLASSTAIIDVLRQPFPNTECFFAAFFFIQVILSPERRHVILDRTILSIYRMPMLSIHTSDATRREQRFIARTHRHHFAARATMMPNTSIFRLATSVTSEIYETRATFFQLAVPTGR